MHTNFVAYLPSAGLPCPASLKPRNTASRLVPRVPHDAAADSTLGGPDAYKVAVLLLAGATILTLF